MISLILIACSLGLVPNEERAALELRAKITENIAIQLADAAGRGDPIAIKDSIASIVSRNKEVLSIAVRGADGKVLAASENHSDHWREPDEGMWEVRGPRRHFVHSKLMVWVCFDRGVRLVEEFGRDGAVAPRSSCRRADSPLRPGMLRYVNICAENLTLQT